MDNKINKHKGYMELSYEALRSLILMPLSIKIDSIENIDRYEKIRIKLSSSQEEKHHVFEKDITKKVEEASSIDNLISIKEEDITDILVERIKNNSSSLNNKEFLDIILKLVDERPNLKEYIAKQILSDKRDNTI